MRVVVLMGGRSGEHDISLISGAAVVDALATLKHAQLVMTFDRAGGATWRDPQESTEGSGSMAAAMSAIEGFGADVAFIAMHGSDGEDGRIQGALELLAIPYQGSGVCASAVCMDKARTKAVYRAHGLPVAEDVVVESAQEADWQGMAARLGLPLVLKTAASGSSVGVEVVQDLSALEARGKALLQTTHSLVVEQWLSGRELTVPVLENADGVAEALPLIEIRPRTNTWFDYEAKYQPGATEEICPAPIDDDLASTLRRLGLNAHHALGCRGYSRTDVMLDANGRPCLLETNTLPGLTPASLLPQAAVEAGIAFPELIERLLTRAMAPSGQP